MKTAPESSDTTTIENSASRQGPALTSAFTPLLLKRSKAAAMLDVGRTLLNELGTEGHPNFDPTFPKPVFLTANGPAFFDYAELKAWVEHRKRISRNTGAANDPQFDPEA